MDYKEISRTLISEKGFDLKNYTKEEIDFLKNFEGSGGTKFSNANSPSSVLHEFFTPYWVCELMFELAYKHGYQDGKLVLEPSCGIGRFAEFVKNKSKITLIEADSTLCNIASLLYPKADVHNLYFEQLFLKKPRFSEKIKESWIDKKYDLVIGNPPYGINKSRYSWAFKNFPQLEVMFIFQSLMLLKSGGILVFITAQNFMRNGDKYNAAKDMIGEQADLIDAYRLPSVFKNTEVPTDIIVLRKK